MNKWRLILIVHDVRSSHNVGSILRSADGLGVERVYLTGYTPHPATRADKRLPHVAKRASEQIAKTALGAEKTVRWTHEVDIFRLMSKLANQNFLIAALEQTDTARDLSKFETSCDIALVVGNEIGGVDSEVLNAAEIHLSIPMMGSKESFNVAVAASVALYHLRWYNHKPDDRQNKNASK